MNRQRLGLLVLAGTAFLLSTDLTMVNVALGELRQELGASMSQLGWLVDGYSIAMVSLLLCAAPLGDRWGQRRVFLLGLATFALGSLLGSVSPGITALIVARMVMGVGAALMLAPAQLLTTGLFPPEQRTAAFATWSTAGALGLCIGPLLGGLLVDAMGWRLIFAVNLPCIALALPLGLRVLPSLPGRPERRLDALSVLASSLGLCLSLGALIQGPDQGWRSAALLVAAISGLLLLLLFLHRQLRLAAPRQATPPLLQLSVWRLRGVRQALLALFAMTISFNGAQFLAVIHLQQQQWSAISIGLLLAPYALVVWLASRAAAPLSRRIAAHRLMALAFLPMLLGFLVLTLPAAGSRLGPLTGLGLVLGGLGQGLLAPVATTTVFNGLPPGLLGSGAGLAMLARFLGASFGVALLDAALASAVGFSGAGLIGAALLTVCLLLMAGSMPKPDSLASDAPPP
jgi:EmrB/QacA subfamily drug resistance transporter